MEIQNPDGTWRHLSYEEFNRLEICVPDRALEALGPPSKARRAGAPSSDERAEGAPAAGEALDTRCPKCGHQREGA